MVINPIVGVYIPIITIPIKGEMTIPNIASLDPGTYIYLCVLLILMVSYVGKYTSPMDPPLGPSKTCPSRPWAVWNLKQRKKVCESKGISPPQMPPKTPKKIAGLTIRDY